MSTSSGWRAPQRAGNSIDASTELRSKQAGRSGVIRAAAAKARDNPPTWRAGRRSGPVVSTHAPKD